MRGDGRFAAAQLSISPVGRAAVLAGAFLLAAACSDKRRTADSDSVLARDLQLATQVTAQPTFQDTALNSPASNVKPEKPVERQAPSRPRRRPPPEKETRVAEAPRAQAPTTVPAPVPSPSPAPLPAPSKEIGAGTGIGMTSSGRVCTDSNRVGDKMIATIDSPITGTNGATIPAGSKVVLEIASVTPAQPAEQTQIVFRVRALYINDVTYNMSGDVLPQTGLQREKVAGDPNGDKKKVIGGAIAGAILGQILGHNTKGTVIGAATGAAAGAVAAKASEKYQACLPEGARLHMTLGQAVALQ